MSDEWFRETFGAHYLSLYAHRDEREAVQTVRLLENVLALPPGARVLDAPCGAGRHARQFLSHGFKIFALDLSWDLLHAARRNSPPPAPHYMRADLRAIPARDASFDAVVNLFSSFGYLETDEDNLQVLKELSRVCRAGGHVVLDFFNATWVRKHLLPQTQRQTPEGWNVLEQRQICGTPPRVEKLVTVRAQTGQQFQIRESVRLFTAEELRELMNQASLRLVRQLGDYHGSDLSPSSPRVILVGEKE